MRSKTLARPAAMFALGLALAACSPGAKPTAAPTTPTTPVVAPPAGPQTVMWNRLHGPIRSVSLSGATNADYTRVQPLLNAVVGQPFDRAMLRDVLDKAMAAQTLSDLDVHGEQLADGVKLVVVMIPQPKVLAVIVHDDKGAPLPVPTALAGLVNQPLSPLELDATLDHLRDEAQSAGYVAYRSQWKPIRTPGSVNLDVTIDAGVAVTISKLEFRGNKQVKTADLEHAIGRDLAIGTPWLADHVERAILLLTTYYYDHGFVEVTITSPPATLVAVSPVVFEIKEGAVYHLSKLAITGLPDADAKKLLPNFKLKTGAVFSRSEVIAGITKVRDQLIKDGHPKVDIEPQTELDTKKHTVTLTFAIALDPKS